MKTSDEVTADKLRGGFYSPDLLVQVCLDRVQRFLGDSTSIHLLEPSAGDGAFVRGLATHNLRHSVGWMTAIEVIDDEAKKSTVALMATDITGEVVCQSALTWAQENSRQYDAAVGNPPFVRFQFVATEDRQNADDLARKWGLSLGRVGNLWIPILLASLKALRAGGAFAFIVPAECFTGISGHEVREWLLNNVHRLEVDVFSPGSFPGVLQEVVILSGQTAAEGLSPTRDLHIREHTHGVPREWTHLNVSVQRTWTRFLLSPAQLAGLETVLALGSVVSLSQVAKFEVATVTGANTFFCVDAATLDHYDLWDWARALLPRTRYAAGLSYTERDDEVIGLAGHPAYLVHFAADRPDPMKRAAPKRYLQEGEAMRLHERYKCRIREPWYRVPAVPAGQLMMAKRSHLFPRVIVNEAGVLTTDTIYRGRLLNPDVTAQSFTAAFHNSITLLTAEIEGRSFGGGVLELVPSEISRLAVPLPEDMSDEFERLDWVCRTAGGESNEALIEETDALVAKKTDGLTKQVMGDMQEARNVLLELRTARN